MKLATVSVICLASFGLVSCGSNVDKNGGTQSPPQIYGTLSDTVKQLQSDSNDLNPDDCDQKYGDLKRAVALELDTRAQPLTAADEAWPRSTKYEDIDVGPTRFLRPKEFVPGASGWVPDITSWQDVGALFEKAKSENSTAEWLDLNSDVKSLLYDDMARIKYWRNYDLDHLSQAPQLKLWNEVKTCNEDASCQIPNFDSEDLVFIASVRLYRDHLADLKIASDKKKELGYFLERLTNDRRVFSFETHASVKRDALNSLSVDLRAGDFRGYEEVLSKIMNSVWSSTLRLTVSIHWVPERATAYRIFFDANTGSRSFVLFDEPEMHLAPLIREHSFAHEMGHVLGFKDHYYTVFKRDLCGYDYQTNHADIMSDSAHGVVTDDEIDELLLNYK